MRRKRQQPGTAHKPGIGYKDSIGSAYKLEQVHKDSRGNRRKWARWVKKGKPAGRATGIYPRILGKK